MATAVGEDRSNFQAVRSWKGNDFGFCKATEGLTFTDPTFSQNWANLKAEGIPRGAYHFFHPALSATAQASFFVNAVKSHGGFQHGDVFMCDAEITTGTDGLEKLSTPLSARRAHVPLQYIPAVSPTCAHQPLATQVDGASVWCSTCSEYCGGIASTGPITCTGCTQERQTVARLTTVDSAVLAFLDEVATLVKPCRVVLYTDMSMAQYYVTGCTAYELFIAYYASNPPRSVAPWKSWGFWQKEGGGGIGGGDLDYFNGDGAAVKSWFGVGTTPTPTPTPKPTPSPTPTPNETWTDKLLAELPTLSQGATGTHVRTLQGLLEARGYNCTIDGSFGPSTKGTIQRFQTANKLTADGTVGVNTWTKLHAL
jgi:GH25 family lysozyme M1 (1,4-beta-N-acetylmuramidase)